MVNEHNMYMEMLRLLEQYEKDIYSDWCDGLEQTCLMNLNQPLILRHPSSGLISVNFNPKVTYWTEKYFFHCTTVTVCMT